MRLIVGGVMPDPGGREDGVQAGEFRGPAEFAADFFRAGDKGGWIARAAGGFDRWDVASGDAGGGRDDFTNAEAVAIAEVVDEWAGGV